MSRADLLALTPESVASLANLGLVKRAQREIAEGLGPSLEEDAAGVVTGTFRDGVVTKLVPSRSLRETPCSCGAVVVCRHRVAVALAYPAWHADNAAPVSSIGAWSPACFTDAMLEAGLGKRVVERARAIVRSSVVVEIEAGEIPAARLPTCSVRFLVPRDLAYAQCDCAAKTGCEHVAVAVFAFREAEAIAPEATKLTIGLGTAAHAEIDAKPLDEALDLAAFVLSEGVAHVDASVDQRFSRVRDALAKAGLVWPLDLVFDLEAALAAYRDRSARYSSGVVTEILASLDARSRAVRKRAELPPGYVLGTDEARETLLDHVRLVSVGARVDADERARDAEVYLVDPDSGVVLVLDKRWTYGEGETPEEGPALARRSMAGRASLGGLARGQVVSRAVKRRANRSMTIGASRAGQTSVTPQSGDWASLPSSVLVRDVAELERSFAERPPRLLRPRLLADSLRVLSVTGVRDVRYHPGDQAIEATLIDAEGAGLRLVRKHRRAAPHALDAIASALLGRELRFVSGDVRRGPLGLEVDPVALVTDRVVVPDIEEPRPFEARIAGARPEPSTPVLAAIDLGASALHEACHIGLSRLRPEWDVRALDAARKLDDVGLAAGAKRLMNLAERTRSLRNGPNADTARAAAKAWMDAAIRIDLVRERA